jgi:hypothetical protein
MKTIIIKWKQRTADGLRWRYRTRMASPNFWTWLQSTSAVDHNEDWPWAYWSFSDPKDEARMAEIWGEPDYYEVDDDTMDTAPPALIPPPSPRNEEIFSILQEEIMKEINREALARMKSP